MKFIDLVRIVFWTSIMMAVMLPSMLLLPILYILDNIKISKLLEWPFETMTRLWANRMRSIPALTELMDKLTDMGVLPE